MHCYLCVIICIITYLCIIICIIIYMFIYALLFTFLLLLKVLTFLGVFLGPYLWHKEVPRLGVELEPTPEPQQGRIRAASAIYTTAHGNARSFTHWARPRIEPATSWIPVRFVNCWAMAGTPKSTIFNKMLRGAKSSPKEGTLKNYPIEVWLIYKNV